jgi:hypothetical protein
VRLGTAAVLLLLLSCTEQAATPRAPRDTPVPAPTKEPQPPPRATIRLVAQDDPSLGAYLEGVRFAVDEVTARGDLDLRLLQAPTVDAALALNPAAVLSIGNPRAVAESRTAIEQAGVPVVLIGGDLYTAQQLFRYAFQTAVPVRWQARVFASYFLEDRGHTRTALVTSLETNEVVGGAFNAAWAEEGGSLERIVSAGPGSLGSTADDLDGLESVVFVGSPTEAAELASGLSSLADPPQLALSAEGLDVSFLTEPNRAVAGTVACYAYTWSGWADMLPRVHDFRERFADAVGHFPASLEQEGYDAVMAIADALVRTGGEAGDRLVQELETFREETYSSVPVRLGPDDHVFAEQSHLGLLAIEEPVDGALPPPEASSLVPWRPILRTFTTDGEKVNFLDRDKRIFFPFWRPKRPTPKYWRAEFGIVSRSSDPLH